MLNCFSILSLFIFTQAQAQTVTIEKDAYRLAHEIRIQSPNLSQEQRTKIEFHFKAVRDILNSTDSNADYLCVSRDNDGKNPYTLAFRNGAELKKINGSTFQNAADCHASLSTMKMVKDGFLICISRDSDGKDPWQLGFLDPQGGMKKMDQSVTSSFADCLNLLKN